MEQCYFSYATDNKDFYLILCDKEKDLNLFCSPLSLLYLCH